MKKRLIIPEIDFVNLLTDESIMTEQIFLSGNSFSNEGVNFIDSEAVNDYSFWKGSERF